MRHYIVVILLFFYASPSLGRIFYVSSSLGDDSRSITEAQNEATPWKSISQVNSVMNQLLPGDSILLCRGDVFFDKLQISKSGNATHSIIFDAYVCNTANQNKLPIISGGIPLSNAQWQPHTGQILYANVSSLVSAGSLQHLYVNNKMYWLARYPNANQGRSSYLFVNDGSMSHLVCANLTQANGYWQGANLRIRTSDWTYETRAITNSESSGTLRFSDLGYATKAGWGFYLDNKFEQLDVETEWFYNPSTKLIYVYPESASVRTAILQNTAEVIASSTDYGITVGGGIQFIEIRNLHVTKNSNHGINVDGNAKNILLENLEIDHSNIAGIQVGYSGQLITIRDNIIHDTLGKGIVSNSNNCTIIRNTVTDIGLVPGYGWSGVNGAIGIQITGSYSLVQHNTISRTGYIGIRYDGTYHLIDSNLIADVLLTMSDGSLLYSWGDNSYGSTVSNNLVMNSWGNSESTSHPTTVHADGIYLDDNTSGYKIINNTVINVGSSGIFVHNSKDNIIQGNKVINCNSTAIRLSEDTIVGFGATDNNTVEGNKLYHARISSSVRLFSITSSFASIDHFGSYNNNYYCAPYNNITHSISYSGYSNTFTLSEFSSFTKNDTNSQTCKFQGKWTAEDISFKNATNLLPSYNFLVNRNPWSCSHSTYCNTLTNVNSTTEPLCQDPTGCLRVTNDNQTAMSKVLGVQLQANKKYLAEFYAATNATAPLTVTNIIQKDQSPYNGYGSRDFKVSSSSGTQKCSWNFIMSTTDSVLYQIMYTAQYSPLTTLVFSSPTLNEIETVPSLTLQIPTVHSNTNFNSTQWNGMPFVDSDGNLVPQTWTVPPLYGMLLFAADCRYTIDCGANACNTTTGQCICPNGFFGVYCDQQQPITTGDATSSSSGGQLTTTGGVSSGDQQITTGEAASGDQDVSSSVKVVVTAFVLVFGVFLSL